MPLAMYSPLQLRNNNHMDNLPSVSLGGKQWVIPQLAAKQNKIIDPLILSLLPIFSALTNGNRAAIAGIDAVKYNDLLTIAFTAVTRATPNLKRDEFEDLPITLPELIAAFNVIAEQTGVFVRAEPSGEAMAGENSQTGTK